MKKPVRDAKFRKAWSESNDRCQVCGKTDEESRRDNGGVGLETHHIIRFKRSDEACNLLRVCSKCHGLIHDSVFRDSGGREIPHLTLGAIIAIKASHGEFDLARLQELYGQALPEAEIPAIGQVVKSVVDKINKQLRGLPVAKSKQCPRCRRVGNYDPRRTCVACLELNK